MCNSEMSDAAKTDQNLYFAFLYKKIKCVFTHTLSKLLQKLFGLFN